MVTKRHRNHVRLAYQFIEANKRRYSVETMCQVLEVAPSGYYAWIKKPTQIVRRKMPDCFV